MKKKKLKVNKKPTLFKTLFIGYLSLFGVNAEAKKYSLEKNYTNNTIDLEDYQGTCTKYLDTSKDFNNLALCLYTGDNTPNRKQEIFSDNPSYIKSFNSSSSVYRHVSIP